MIRTLVSIALLGLSGAALAQERPAPRSSQPLAIPVPDQPRDPPAHPPPPGQMIRYVPRRTVVMAAPQAPVVEAPAKVEAPARTEIDRAETLAVGVRWGSLYSGSFGGHSYADLGLGLVARYRPASSIGLEAAVQHHDQTWSARSNRSQTLMSGSVVLFAWSWTRVSPYAVGGLTWVARDVHHDLWDYEGVDAIRTRRPLAGPHAGLGLELALGRNVALDLEARYVNYLNRRPNDPALPGAFTTTAAIMIHL